MKYATQLAMRLVFLKNVADDEQDEGLSLSPDSLKFFVSFLHTHTNFEYPEVVLSPSGNIRAEWRVSTNRHFAVEFLPTGDCRFVIFAPNKLHSEKTVRLSGSISVDLLVETVTPHGVLNWAALR